MRDRTPLIAPLVDYYGPERVWKCTLAVLGFPATWTTTITEANRINDRLRKDP